jgi:hypothetical protein
MIWGVTKGALSGKTGSDNGLYVKWQSVETHRQALEKFFVYSRSSPCSGRGFGELACVCFN